MTEESLFHMAREKPPAERAEFLAAACPDPDLRRRVEVLLRAHDDSGNFLAGAAVNPPTGTYVDPHAPTQDCAASEPGAVIGPYKLLEVIGEGGMGEVWMAEQTEPVRRQVALKLIKPGMDSKAVLARFEAERQALALMDHPNVARVYDAGTTDSGRPYFVMELIKGSPITRYCDEQHLTVRQRLELFVQVCQAVQHAHQKGVIHRDLKPSNMLVALYDGKPVPKVIDFGVAKAAGLKLTERTLFTGFGQVVGTLEYMSPEQAELNQLDVDTRTDVYSLGVLLYELLTGTTPLGRKRLSEAALLEALRLIREEEPPKPSTRLSTTTAELPAIAANRSLDARQLRGLVKGELDWIVMKALEKDRNRRYDTPTSFAMDILRHLRDEPVQACPPSVAYRVRKFARRNKLGLLIASVIAVGLLLAIGSLAFATIRVEDALAQKTQAFDDLKVQKQKADEALEREKQALVGVLAEQDRTKRALSLHAVALADREWWLNHPGRTEELLDSVSAGFRNWEWHYLKRRCHQELLTLRGHTGTVSLVSWTGDGNTIVTAGADRTIRTWDAATGRLRGHIALPPCTVRDVSRDGTRAVVSGKTPGGLAGFWVVDTATGREVFSSTAFPQPNKPMAAAFSPDGRRVALAAVPLVVKVFDLATGQEERSLTHADLPGKVDPRRINGVFRVAFAPDGNVLAFSIAGPNSQAVLLDVATGKLLPSHLRTPGAYLGLAFSPDGRRMAGLTTNGDLMFGTAGGVTAIARTRVAEDEDSTGLDETTGNIQFSPDGRLLVTGGSDGTVRFWTAAGQLDRIYRGHAKAVNGVAFSPDGRRFVSCSSDQTVKVWDATQSQDVTVLTRAQLNRFTYGYLAVGPDGRRFAGAPTGRPGDPPVIRIWSEPGGKDVAIDCGTIIATGLIFSPSGRYLTATLTYTNPKGATRLVKVYDSDTGRELYSSPELRPGDACTPSVSGDGRRLVVEERFGTERVVKLLDAETLGVLTTRNVPANHQINVRYLSHDGRYLAVVYRDSARNEIRVWDLDSVDGVSLTIPLDGITATNVAFSPDGRLVAVGTIDGTVALWDRESGQKRHTWSGHVGTVQAAFSPDGARLATLGADRRPKLWDPATGRELLALPPARGVPYLNHLTFSPDSHRLVLTGPTGAAIWDATPWVEPPF